jgi:hypothetical protein
MSHIKRLSMGSRAVLLHGEPEALPIGRGLPQRLLENRRVNVERRLLVDSPFSPRGGEGDTVRTRTPQVRRSGSTLKVGVVLVDEQVHGDILAARPAQA